MNLSHNSFLKAPPLSQPAFFRQPGFCRVDPIGVRTQQCFCVDPTTQVRNCGLTRKCTLYKTANVQTKLFKT